jgi:hydroxylamine reductase (hybrid-cluster protein)
VLEPPKSYKDRLFTTNEAGLSGVKHVGEDKDFGSLIQAALEAEGFNDDTMPELEPGHPGHYTVGFGHQVAGGAVVLGAGGMAPARAGLPEIARRLQPTSACIAAQV